VVAEGALETCGERISLLRVSMDDQRGGRVGLTFFGPIGLRLLFFRLPYSRQ